MVTLDERAGAGRAGRPVVALGVDAVSGGLVVEDAASDTGERLVHAGEVIRVRLAGNGV